MKAFGEHLVRARTAAGLSLEDIHERTRISRKNLQLLEAGDFPSIPQTYIRAFVREYARIVGLDEEETLDLYNELAERDRGVPPPPSSIDSSNILPRIDDSVEFIPVTDRSSSHVEIDGTAEAVDDEFVPNIRKSSYVSEDSAPPIEIRTTAPPPDRSKESQPRTASDKMDETSSSEPPQQDTAKEIVGSSEIANAGPAGPSIPHAKVSDNDEAGIQGARSAQKDAIPAAPRVTSAAGATAAAAPGREKIKPARPSVYDTKPPIEDARTMAEGGPEKSQDRRIIGIGLVVIAMLAVAVYGIYFFSFRSDHEESAIDSTAIKASIEAGRFIDSTQAAFTDIELPPDTIPIIQGAPPEPVETKPKVYARDDSLVLEAFTNAPVWFSVKMDTLRTERGSLSSNEHRVWKARDYFVVTLGDAGAVTFFLNGKEIGTLGDEGSVVKNVVLSRSRTRGD